MRKHKILYLILLISSTVFSQELYVDLSADANKLTGAIDNPYTNPDHRGLDFDLEVGAHAFNFAVYMFYGRFENAGYQNYGAGTDYYFYKSDKLDIGAGVAVSVIMRKVEWDEELRGWAGFMGSHVRVVGTYWAFDNWGVTGRLQGQQRRDLDIFGVVEGSVGIKYRMFNKNFKRR